VAQLTPHFLAEYTSYSGRRNTMPKITQLSYRFSHQRPTTLPRCKFHPKRAEIPSNTSTEQGKTTTVPHSRSTISIKTNRQTRHRDKFTIQLLSTTPKEKGNKRNKCPSPIPKDADQAPTESTQNKPHPTQQHTPQPRVVPHHSAWDSATPILPVVSYNHSP
jgi:hypothetical protein